MKRTLCILMLALLSGCGLTYDLDSVEYKPFNPSPDGGTRDADATDDNEDMQVAKNPPDAGEDNDAGASEIITVFSTDKQDNTFTIGEEITFVVETTRAGFLTLELQKSTGVVLRLIPSAQEENPVPIEANTQTTLPPANSIYTFNAGSPRGTDIVRVFFLNENQQIVENAVVEVTVQ